MLGWQKKRSQYLKNGVCPTKNTLIPLIFNFTDLTFFLLEAPGIELCRAVDVHFDYEQMFIRGICAVE